MKINLFIALAGSVITLVQFFLLTFDGDGICFNEGCKIVDSLTTVSPLMINVAGFFFFQLVMWGLWFARKGGQIWLTMLKTLLLAGMAVEGVLVAFQYLIAKTLCSYCLIILCVVVLLNVFTGVRQMLFSGAVFVAVLLAFAGLKFSSAREPETFSLEQGAFAYVKNSSSDRQLYLFFSSSCPYCEIVMEGITEENICNIRFNPINTIESVAVDDAVRTDSYLPDVNRSFLQGLGIDEIPVLAIEEPGQFLVIKGEKRIQEYLRENCMEEATIVNVQNEQGFSEAQGFDFLTPSQGDDSCSVSEDCEDSQNGSLPQQVQE